MDFRFLLDTLLMLLPGVPLTVQLALSSLALGGLFALPLALMRMSSIAPLNWVARSYVFAFRSTPLLVQIFLIYYGLGQFREVRASLLWPILREPYWCAVIALTLNTAAYSSEIIRGGILAVPFGQIEAARAVGMNRLMALRRIIVPQAYRQALPAYGNELILMIKATSLASIITIMEVTGIAAKLISETFRAVEVFIVAGAVYLVINFVVTRLVKLAEHRLTPHLRSAPISAALRERA